MFNFSVCLLRPYLLTNTPSASAHHTLATDRFRPIEISTQSKMQSLKDACFCGACYTVLVGWLKGLIGQSGCVC
jgi:hypothetical protein